MGDDKKSDKKKDEQKKKPENFRESVTTMPGWKKTVLILSAVIMFFALGIQIMAANSRDEGEMSALQASSLAPTPKATPSKEAGGSGIDLPANSLTSGLVATNPDAEQPVAQGPTAKEALKETDSMDVYSLGILRLSFSFFAGIAVAHFLRTLMKATLIGAGFLILGLFALQYAGFIEVKWDMIGEKYETFGAWAGSQLDSFRVFVTGALPSVGAAGLGAVLGFVRK